MSQKTNFIDKEITQKVQVIQLVIPDEVEQSFMKALQHAEPLQPQKTTTASEQNFHWRHSLLAAATILLMVVMLLVYSSRLHQSAVKMPVNNLDEVIIQNATVEGKPANTVLINPKDSNITIVWLEKCK